LRTSSQVLVVECGLGAEGRFALTTRDDYSTPQPGEPEGRGGPLKVRLLLLVLVLALQIMLVAGKSGVAFGTLIVLLPLVLTLCACARAEPDMPWPRARPAAKLPGAPEKPSFCSLSRDAEYTCAHATKEMLYQVKEEDRLGGLLFLGGFYAINGVLFVGAWVDWRDKVSQNGYLMGRRGCSLPANVSGFDPHRASMTSRFKSLRLSSRGCRRSGHHWPSRAARASTSTAR
jgi:hypothetical protein